MSRRASHRDRVMRRNRLRAPLLTFFALLSAWWWLRPDDRPDLFLRWAAADPNVEFQILDRDDGRKPAVVGARAPRRYETFAHRVLDLDSWQAAVSDEKYALLDSIIDDVKSRVAYDPSIGDAKEQGAQAKRILKAIDAVLTDHGFLYPPGDYDVCSLRAALSPQRYDQRALETLLRLDLNKRRRDHAAENPAGPFYIIDCDISSILYVGVAEALGIELHLVDLPDHMFVRWELGDGTQLNWDTNDAEFVTDEDYASDYGLKKRLRTRRVYLSSTTRREAEGYVCFLRGVRFEDRGDEAKAIADLEKARELYPQSTQVRGELAWLYATADRLDQRRRSEALELAAQAVELEPQCGDFWDSLAAAHAANGDFKTAAKEARKAEHMAESNAERGDFRGHRKAYEAGKMPAKR